MRQIRVLGFHCGVCRCTGLVEVRGESGPIGLQHLPGAGKDRLNNIHGPASSFSGTWSRRFCTVYCYCLTPQDATHVKDELAFD